PELEEQLRAPAVDPSCRQQGNQMRQDEAGYDRTQDRPRNLALGNTRPARVPIHEPGAHEDAEGHQRAERGERAASADRNLAKLEIGDHGWEMGDAGAAAYRRRPGLRQRGTVTVAWLTVVLPLASVAE